MTIVELADLVREMREMQAAYFRHRDRESLAESKKLEKGVDEAIGQILRPSPSLPLD
jgi:hypothetical protein